MCLVPTGKRQRQILVQKSQEFRRLAYPLQNGRFLEADSTADLLLLLALGRSNGALHIVVDAENFARKLQDRVLPRARSYAFG